MTMNRRRFVQGFVMAGAAAAFDWRTTVATGETLPWTPKTLEGNEFELTIDTLPVNFTGRSTLATAVNGSVPGPTLKWREGDTVTLAVTNRLKVSTSLHWHGLRIPSEMDGVPGLSFAGIAPGERFVYRLPLKQSGTYWYHSHSGYQEQTGILGALIIEPRDRDPITYDREYVILLSDWSDTDPKTIFSNLKGDSDYYNYHRRTLHDFVSDANGKGTRSAISDRLMWGRMNMSPTDIADVSGSTYTYLLNGNTPNANWTGIFESGEKIRLRFINGSSMTFFDIRIPGLPMTVVQADGNSIEPVTVDEFRMGVAEAYDVIVEPHEDTAYTVFAQAEDRTGFARGTLAPCARLTADIPSMDPRPQRTMADMGMRMSGMTGMRGMNNMNMTTMEPMSGSNMGGKSMEVRKDTGKMNVAQNLTVDADIVALETKSVAVMPLLQPGPNAKPLVSPDLAERAMNITSASPEKPHVGPEVAMVAAMASSQLANPGVGLKNNGRRVLTYADLRARYRGVDGRPPSREIELHLTGNMDRFIWGFDGKKFSEAPPIELKLGERVRFVLINDTMMEHPIHLHGLWSELENGHGEFNPYKHTVVVKPAERVSYLVTADTVGRWAYHCHLLFHMKAGMFRTVVVS